MAKFLSGKREHFLTRHCKNQSFVPSPDKYEVTGNLLMQNPKKRMFSKLPRLTEAAEIIKKGSETPGPGTYRISFAKKRKGSHKPTEARELGFINDAMYKGKNTPSVYDSNYKLVESKPRFTDFRLSTVERKTRIEKKPGLSPAAYESLQSFNKTQLCVRTTGFSKQKIQSFSEKLAQAKKFVPPPGQYDFEKCESKVYKPFSRKRR